MLIRLIPIALALFYFAAALWSLALELADLCERLTRRPPRA